MTKLSDDEKAMREGLRTQTQRKATELMNKILKEQQAAAQRGDHAQYRYYQEQISAVAESSKAADYQAIDRAVIAWNTMQQEKLTDAERAAKEKAPAGDPVERLNRARRTQAHGRKELDRLEREKMKALKGE
jgi:hypothetical protein